MKRKNVIFNVFVRYAENAHKKAFLTNFAFFLNILETLLVWLFTNSLDSAGLSLFFVKKMSQSQLTELNGRV